MVRKLVEHSWLAFWRSKTLGRSLGTTIFTWVMILIIILYTLGLGFVLERLLLEIASDTNVISTLNSFLIFYWLVELIMRTILQKNISLNIQYYLSQNIPKRSLAHFMLIKSLRNLFLLITMLLFSPFAFSVISEAYGTSFGWLWLGSLLVMSLVLHFVTIIIQQYSKGGLLTPFLIVVGLIACIYLNHYGYVDISSFSVILMEKFFQQPILGLIPVFLIAALYYFSLRLVIANLSLDSLSTRTGLAKIGIRRWVVYLNSCGQVGQLMSLELRLIWRNKRPRALMLSSIFMIAYFVIFLGRFDQSIFIGVFVLVSTGAFMVNYGQLLFSWESGYFDFILTRNISPKVYLTSKFALLIAFNTLSLIIMSIVLAIINIALLKDLIIWYLINSGFFIYVFIWGTMLGPKAISVNARAMFNYEGLSAFQFLIIIPYFAFPIGTAYLLTEAFGNETRDLLLAAIGITGIIFYQVILKTLANRFVKRKYKISNGFRE